MGNMLPTTGTSTKGKSILAPNEKIVSWLGAAGITAFLVWVGIKVVPILIAALVNWLILGAILGGTGLALWLVWSNRAMIALRYQLFIKKLWRGIVKSDPISVMEIQWRKWTQKRQELNRSITTMKAAENELLNAMNEKESRANQEFAQAKKAQELKDKRNDPEYGRKATKSSIIANRLMQSNQNLIPRLKAIQKAIDYCSKLYARWGDDLELLKQDIDLKKEDLRLLSSTSNAFDSARSLLNDDPDERALWEMATEAHAEKVSNYVANITRFTEQAKDWVYNKDIQEAVWEDQGEQLLSMYDTETFAQLTDFRSLMTKDENASFAKISNEYQKVLAQPRTSPSHGTFKDLV
jgi:hypothetical protein